MRKAKVKFFCFNPYSDKEFEPLVVILNVSSRYRVNSCAKSYMDNYNEGRSVRRIYHYEILEVFRGD